MSEGSRHFDERSAVFGALHKITARLAELHISYAVVGGMALFRHGLRRFTEDVDILVTKEDLKRIHAALVGLGYRPAHARSKYLRDTEFGIRIEFLTTGDYPGDGKQKPVAFPDPAQVSFEADGICYLNLPNLIELKLASGMTGAGRLKDLADVQELIQLLSLPQEFAEQLNPYVRDKFAELSKHARKRFVLLWPKDPQAARPKTWDEMIAALPDDVEELEAMRDDGIMLDKMGGADDRHIRLTTTDPDIAQKYDMAEETELWGDDDQYAPQEDSPDRD